MESIKEKPSQLILFVDDALAYGINQAYYPEVLDSVNSSNVKIIGLNDSIDFQNECLITPKENEMFIYNTYSSKYLSLDDDIETKYLESKLYCFQGLLGIFGALKFEGEVSKIEEKEVELDIKGNISYKLLSSSVNAQFTKKETLKQNLKISRRFEVKTIKTLNEIRNYVREYNLGSELFINNLLKECEYQNGLKGVQEVSSQFSNDLNSTLDIGLKLGCSGLFDLSSNVQYKLKQRKEINYSMKIEF